MTDLTPEAVEELKRLLDAATQQFDDDDGYDRWADAQVACTTALHNAAPELITRYERAAVLEAALAESVALQSHYAKLLNQYDGGERRIFTVDQWIARLAELEQLK